tara:strand:+ start:403 stop:1605 length:1203 start_codon:yes stop_codon:yes gene_type:complete
MPPKERKIKPPDDPTIMVDGVPKLSINANKLQIAEYLKIHKALHNKTVGVYGYRDGPKGKLRKTSKQMREELIAGGHMVGELTEQAKKNPGRKGGASKPANIAAKIAEEKQIASIKLNGWTSEAVKPAPDPAVINMSGYGGIPIDLAPAPAPAPKVSDDTQSDLVEDTSVTDPITFEGIDYHVGLEDETIYKDAEGKIVVGKFNEDMDDILWINAAFEAEHVARRAASGQWASAAPQVTLPAAVSEAVEDFEFPESDGWDTVEPEPAPEVSDDELSHTGWTDDEEEAAAINEAGAEAQRQAFLARKAKFEAKLAAEAAAPAPSPEVSDDDTDSDYDSNDDLVDPLTPVYYEMVDYWDNQDTGEIYKDIEGKILIGKWNGKMNKIIFANDAAKEYHYYHRP